MAKLAILFILWPLLELAVLIRVGQATGVGTAILLVVLPAILGAALARHEGLRTYGRIQQELAGGHLPGDQLIEALLILVAGVLLITPGLISDTLGLLLLIPPLRRFVRERVKRRFRDKVSFMHFGSPGACQAGDDQFVDVKAEPVERRRLSD